MLINYSKILILSLLMLILVPCVQASEASIDSLKQVLSQDLSVENRFQTLAYLTRDFRYQEDSSIKYGRILLAEATEYDNKRYVSVASVNLGQAYKDKGAYEIATNYLLQALAAGKEVGENLHNQYGLLGGVYGRLGDMKKSAKYFRESLVWAEDHKYPSFLKCISINNLGEAYYLNGYMDSADFYFRKAYDIAQENKYGVRFFLNGNIGMMNLEFGNLDSAGVQLRRVLLHLDETQTAYLTFKTLLSRLYTETSRYDSAMVMLTEVVKDAQKLGFKEQLRDALLQLSKVQKIMGEASLVLTSYEKYVAVKEELENIETYSRITNLQSEFDLAQKEAEIQVYAAEKKSQEVILIVVGIFTLVLVVFVLLLVKQNRSKTRLNVQLSKQKGELEILNQTKDKFFSIISHDLRGPVSAFYGVSRVIKFLAISNRTDDLVEIADDINNSVDQLSSLLDNLLNWAMQQRGHIPNVPEKIDVALLVKEILKSLNTLAQSKNIDLESDLDHELHLWADRNIASTILRNLINNSLKFTPEGGQVHVNAISNGRMIQISVQDSGIGIPEYRLKNLFQQRNDSTTYGTSGEKGLGLGLQLVKDFIEMIGGRIEVSSEINHGSVFTVMIPAYDSRPQLVDH